MSNRYESLKELTKKIGSGATPSGGQSNYKEEGISLIRSQNVLDMTFSFDGLAFIDEEQALKLSNVEVLENDILLNITGDSIARVCKVPKEVLPARVNQHVSILRSNEKIDSSFLLYYLIFLKKYLLTISRVGGTRNALTKDAIEKIQIRIEPQQEKVASVLSSLDKKIELNNKINAELEAMAKTLYDYWFVQFDFPNEDGKPYKSSGGKMVYSEVLKREIPEGWEVTVFNNWLKNTKTGDWGKDGVEGNYTERVYCVRGADINGLNGKGDVKAPERFILKNNLTKLLEPNDFVIEISGGSPTQSTARIALLTKETFNRFDTNVVCSNFCKAVTLEDERFVYNFQQEWQRLYDAGVFFGYEGKTSGIKNFLFDSFMDSYHIVKPSEELVLRFSSFAKEIEKKKQFNLKQNEELAELRDWLLPMLMNGQVSVGNAVRESKQEVKKDDRVRNLFGDEEYLKRKMLAVYIINQSLNDKSFGRTKFMKLMHLIEYHIVKDNDSTKEYYEHAAGPYDGAFANKFWDEVIEDKWYRFEELGKLQRVVRGAKHRETEDYVNFIADDLKQQISDFINLFKVTTYKQPEVVSTLYAVWNNRMIQGETPPDSLLIEDFLAWDEQKIKYSDVLDKALGWMRANKIVPTGFGSVIKASKSRRGI